MSIKGNRSGYLIFFGLCGAMMVVGYFQRRARQNNFNVTDRYIYNVESSSKSVHTFVNFYFDVGGEKIKASSSIPVNSIPWLPIMSQILHGHTLKIIYQKNNPDNCEMLFLQKDYNRYKVIPSPEQKLLIQKIDSIYVVDNQ